MKSAVGKGPGAGARRRMNPAWVFRTGACGGGAGAGRIQLGPPASRWVAGGLAAGSIALLAGGLVLAYADRQLASTGLTGWDFSDVFGNVVDLAVPIMGFVLAYKRPANRIGWLFLVAGLAVGLSSFWNQYGLHALIAAPGSLPGGRAFAWLFNWIWVIPVAVLAFVFLLFPDGRLRSRRWRPAAWFVGAAFTLATVGMLAGATHVWGNPFILFDQ